MTRKTIHVEIEISTNQSNYEVCELIEQTLLNGSLNNDIFHLVINETKVIEEKEVKV